MARTVNSGVMFDKVGIWPVVFRVKMGKIMWSQDQLVI